MPALLRETRAALVCSRVSLAGLLFVGCRHGFRILAAERIVGGQIVLRVREMVHVKHSISGAALAAQVFDMIERLLGQPIAETGPRRELVRHFLHIGQ